MFSFMSISNRQYTCIIHLVFGILNLPTMFVDCKDLYMALNRILEVGTIDLLNIISISFYFVGCDDHNMSSSLYWWHHFNNFYHKPPQIDHISAQPQIFYVQSWSTKLLPWHLCCPVCKRSLSFSTKVCHRHLESRKNDELQSMLHACRTSSQSRCIGTFYC